MKVLVAPLDWGLGHATRCVPLIRALGAAGHEVIPCASGAGLRLLRSEFPELQARELPSYAMRYTRHRALLPFFLFLQLPLFLLSARRDARAARRIAAETGAGLILADGRYGFRAGNCPTVFVTHQLEILPPGPRALRALLAPALRALNRRALKGFAEVWVPDFPGRVNLSGTLGHPSPDVTRGGPPVQYIRPLCRFRPDSLPWDRPYDRNAGLSTPLDFAAIDILAVLSGPEPQRTILENILTRTLTELPGTHVLVRGLPHAKESPASAGSSIQAGQLTVIDHLPQDRLLACLADARQVVCRSGYTTMMELAGLGKGKVLLIPTPGQPEQEYLAVQAQASGLAAWRDQDTLEGTGPGEGLIEGMKSAERLPGFARLFSGTEQPGSGPDGASDFDLAAWIAQHPLLNPDSV